MNMLAENSDEVLHQLAREIASSLSNPDRKQLRFNDIVRVARLFYPLDIRGGVVELVQSCNRDSALYVSKRPLWEVLEKEYQWILSSNKQK